MIVTWLIAGIITGVLVGIAFYDDIVKWAKNMFARLSSYVKKAWVFIRRVPGGIKQMIRYIQNGSMQEESEPREVEWDEIVRMWKNGDIDDDTFYALKDERDKKIAELNRER